MITALPGIIASSFRGGGFTPPAPPPTAGFSHWYASRDVLNGSNPADQATVLLFKDLDTPANDLTAGNTDPPIYLADDPNWGLPTVAIDDAGDFFTSSLDVGISGADPWAFFWTGTIFTENSGSVLFGIGAASDVNTAVLLHIPNPGVIELIDDIGNVYFQATAPFSGSNHTFVIAYDGTALRLFMDGFLLGVANVTLNLPADASSLYFGGFLGIFNTPQNNIFESVFYPFALSIAQLNTVGSWYGGVGTGAPPTNVTWTTYVQDSPYWPLNLIGLNGENAPGNNTDPITTWPDVSPQSNSPTQATALNRPTKLTNVLNGLAVVNYISSPFQYFNIPTPFYPDAVWAVYHVVKKANSGGNLTGLSAIGLGSFPYSFLAFSDDNIYVRVATGEYIAIADPATSWDLWTTENNNGVISVWKNGTPQSGTPGSGGSGSTWDVVGIRGSDFSDGQHAAIWAYGTLRDPSIEAFLMSKYAL